jgi:hypothetical protein
LDIIGLLIQIVVAIIVVAPILWLVGRSLAGKQNAKFTDAIWIVVLGIVIGAVHFFDCGWLKAFIIAIIAVVVFIVIAFVLALIGIGIGIGIGSLGF